jgi:sigma-E factor negative regulatory protein RseC
MIEQTLQVVSVEGNKVQLKAEQKPACEGCNGKCGSQVFSKLFGTHKKTLSINIEDRVKIGQKVRLSLDDSHVIRNAFFVYMMPLCGAFFGMFVSGILFNSSEFWQIFAAIIGGVTGFLIAKHSVKSLKHEVRLIKIYPISLPLTQIDGDCDK